MIAYRGRRAVAFATILAAWLLSGCKPAQTQPVSSVPQYLAHDTNEGCSLSRNGDLIVFNPMGRPRSQFAAFSLKGGEDRLFQIRDPAAEVGAVVLAPDGMSAAITVRKYSRWWYDLWVANLQTGEAIRMDKASGSYFGPLAFSPDGASLYYVRSFDFGADASARRKMAEGALIEFTLNKTIISSGFEERLFPHAFGAIHGVGVSDAGAVYFSAATLYEIRRGDRGSEFIPVRWPEYDLSNFAGFQHSAGSGSTVPGFEGLTRDIRALAPPAGHPGRYRLTGVSSDGALLLWRLPEASWVSGAYSQASAGGGVVVRSAAASIVLDQAQVSVNRPCISGSGDVVATVGFTDAAGNSLANGETLVWQSGRAVRLSDVKSRLDKARVIDLAIPLD